jgi:hypothetical protein
VACFTKLYLQLVYHQIKLRKYDIPKTHFRTHDWHFEFLFMLFGLTNAPLNFQILMNNFFRPHLIKFALVSFDDILIYRKSWEDHIKHVDQVLQILENKKLCVK